jgi:hypothetical protein
MMTDEERRQLALEILYKCCQHHYADGPSPFRSELEAGVTIDAEQLYLEGDLAIGFGGAEFTYRYLPIKFVEGLLDAGLAVVTKAVALETQEGEKAVLEAETDAEEAKSSAKNYATAGTVYFLNNLRNKLNEAIEELFIEAKAAIEGIHVSVARDAIAEAGWVVPNIRKTLRTTLVNAILGATEPARRKRIEEAFWEIDPTMRLADLPRHYSELKEVWREAWKIYKANKNFATWRETVKREIQARFNIELPSEGPKDLISFLSNDPADYPMLPRDEFESTASGIALEHAARLCGADRFEFSTGYLRQLVGKADFSTAD